jgi:hypothetical protein
MPASNLEKTTTGNKLTVAEKRRNNMYIRTRGIKWLVCMASVMVAFPVGAETRDGVSTDDVRIQVAQPGFINFDPPCVFAETLPLQTAPYMNPVTKVYFIHGEGAVLNECSNFGVSGHSPPNFLAWNCDATNFDGTRPALPAEIKFLDPVSKVSVKVGSGANAGVRARLIAFDSTFTQIDVAATTLASNLKTLTVTAPGIRYVRLVGPCVMVADDLRVTP